MIAVTRGERPEWSAVRRLLLAILALALLALPVHAAERGVDVRDNSFSPTPITITAGDTVKWTHRGQVLHTVTADDGSFEQNMLPGATFTYTFRTPGTIAYHCEIHSAMRGTVVVQAAAQSTTTTRPSTTTTTRRTTTTLDAGESSVTAPGETTTTSSTVVGQTTTTLAGDTTTSTGDVSTAAGGGDSGNGDDDNPSDAGPAAVAALLLAAVSGGAALAVKRGL